MRKSHAEDHHQQRSHFILAAGLVVFGLVYLFHAEVYHMQRPAGAVHEFVFDEQPCQERPCPVACHAGTLVRSLCRPLLSTHFVSSASHDGSGDELYVFTLESYSQPPPPPAFEFGLVWCA